MGRAGSPAPPPMLGKIEDREAPPGADMVTKGHENVLRGNAKV